MCYPLTVQDDATRYLLCVDGHGSTETDAVQASFVRIFRKHGIPERMHRTLKAKTAQPPEQTAGAQQRHFGRFVRWMNEDRGHEGIVLPGGKVFLTSSLSGELVGLEEIRDGLWRAAYRRTVLCFVDSRGREPRVLSREPDTAEKEPEPFGVTVAAGRV